MGKVNFKPGNMLYPIPAVMVSVTDKKGNDNILTIAWTGTLCTNPPMAYICVRPERYSYSKIMETGEFVINLTTEKLTRATDYCGIKSGRDVDKFAEMRLTKEKAQKVKAPLIAECPVNIECKVKETKELGSHTMFIAEVVAVNVDEKYIDKTGKFNLNNSDLLVYSHGEYFGFGEKLGKFGYSVDKKYVKKGGKTQKSQKPQKSYEKNEAEQNRFESKSEGRYAGKSTEGGYAGKSTEGGYAGKSTEGRYAGKSTEGRYAGKSTEGRYAGKSTEGGYAGKSTEGGYAGKSTEGRTGTDKTVTGRKTTEKKPSTYNKKYGKK